MKNYFNWDGIWEGNNWKVKHSHIKNDIEKFYIIADLEFFLEKCPYCHESPPIEFQNYIGTLKLIFPNGNSHI